MNREKLGEDSWLDTCFLSKDYLDNFDELWKLHPKERGKVLVFGEKTIPRYQQSYLRDYTFSGVNAKAMPLPNEFKRFLDFVNSIPEYNGNFNQVLLNWYENGLHHIGSHSDSESQLIPDSPIVTISLGAERTFRIRNKDKKIEKDIKTENGLVMVMGGKFQKEFKHEIVKINGKKGENTGKRISITFRQFIE